MLEQIQADRSIEITDLDATRFFMTATEAAALVVKADLLGQSGVTYWLDVGRPVKIADLAMRAMVLANHRVPIEVIGLRPGEKRTEALHDQGLELARTAHPRIHAARQPLFDADLVGRTLRSLRHDVAVGDARAALEALVTAVPGFLPSASAIEAAAGSSVGHALGPVEAVPMHRSA
jgi:FlaA1/EpsC-like NDP-sugar epimerase